MERLSFTIPAGAYSIGSRFAGTTNFEINNISLSVTVLSTQSSGNSAYHSFSRFKLYETAQYDTYEPIILYVIGVILSDQDSYVMISRNDQAEVKIKIEDIQI